MKDTADNLLEAMRRRFACKQFDPSRRVSDADFAKILEAARLAPSSFGFEPWQFLVIQNADLREKIRSVSWGVQQQMPGLSHFLVIYARKPAAMRPDGPYLTSAIMEKTQHMPPDMIALRVERFREFLNEDFALTGNDRAGFEWACRQCYLALENMLLMAAALGADACPIEGFHKENLESLLEAEGLLDRETFGVACMAAFGYRKEDASRPKTRRAIEEVVRWVE